MPAKPKHGQLKSNILDIFQPSFPTNHRRHNHPYLRRSKQQEHRRPSGSSLSSTHCPSPAVLSALAVIAATPAVAGSPLPVQTTPPSFLCPFIERDNIDLSSESSTTTPPNFVIQSIPTPPKPTPTPPAQLIKRLLIADKYVQGPDNSWRRTDEWTLYGSTCCSSTNVPSVDDVQAQPSFSSQTTMPTVTPTPVELDASVLPAGWKAPTSTSSNTESTIILALAIAIAGSICIFMVGCIIWRKRKKSNKDIERKIGKKLRPDDASEVGVSEKEATEKMRIWARATARWKANARHSARRRRKRYIASKLSRPPSPVLSDSREMPADDLSAISPQGCFSRVEVDVPMSETTLPSNTDEPVIADQSPVLPKPTTSPRTSSPPAYRSQVMQRHPHHSTSDSNSRRSRDSSLLFEQANCPSIVDDEPIPYVLPRGGHVATDDKAHLARIRELASSPPEMASSPPEMLGVESATTVREVSAPAWHDLPEDDFESGVVPAPAFPFRDFGLPPSFPPLPFKGCIPSGYFDTSFFGYGADDGIPVLGRDVGPSAPPFDAHPSAPPISDLDLAPSAPSLEDENGLFQAWDRRTSYAPASDSSDATAAATARSSISESVTPSGSVSLACGRGSVTKDGILPLYHP
ncbi:hypothetical protein PAXRUDRAFT_132007 [Paxillus rubicundulus Ve08.2h10]|uniref:Uncharacterized protein n=1 Tax=Paxillus rubicundulus Ve08.2h10 TaxID=930991 RepID=A0A0D0E4W5_9AGAM|nr:hypothetical protein PAXRUDRAFT_132007 [Paxillus rubicundulus Ve08.2h10]